MVEAFDKMDGIVVEEEQDNEMERKTKEEVNENVVYPYKMDIVALLNS